MSSRENPPSRYDGPKDKMPPAKEGDFDRMLEQAKDYEHNPESRIEPVKGDNINVLRTAKEGQKGKMEFDWTFVGHGEKGSEEEGLYKVQRLFPDSPEQNLEKNITPEIFWKAQELDEELDFIIDPTEAQTIITKLNSEIKIIINRAIVGKKMLIENDKQIKRKREKIEIIQELLDKQ